MFRFACCSTQAEEEPRTGAKRKPEEEPQASSKRQEVQQSRASSKRDVVAQEPPISSKHEVVLQEPRASLSSLSSLSTSSRDVVQEPRTSNSKREVVETIEIVVEEARPEPWPDLHILDVTHELKAYRFVVDTCFTRPKFIGSGANGVVISARDVRRNCTVAIKKMAGAWRKSCDTDGRRFLREIRILRHLEHPNIVRLLDLIPPAQDMKLNDAYLVMEYMERDLAGLIHSSQLIDSRRAQFFIYQVLRALKYIHSAGIVHRDIKPGNLLVNRDDTLKICDFGLARRIRTTWDVLSPMSPMTPPISPAMGEMKFAVHYAKDATDSKNKDVKEAKNVKDGQDSKESEKKDEKLSEYVVTRWYRAPELLCQAASYDVKIDIWSVGCVFAELLGRRVLFPGENSWHQLRVILDVTGALPKDDLDWFTARTGPKIQHYLQSYTGVGKPLEHVLNHAFCGAETLDLLRKMLQFNPTKRISAEDALKHPYFDNLRNVIGSKLEPVSVPVDDEFEDMRLTKSLLQDLAWEEIYSFRPWLRSAELRPLTVPYKTLHESPGFARERKSQERASAFASSRASTPAPAPAPPDRARMPQTPKPKIDATIGRHVHLDLDKESTSSISASETKVLSMS